MEEDGSSFTNWDGNEPDGNKNENCMWLRSDNGRWGDVRCHWTRYGGYDIYAVCSKPIASAANDTIGRRKRQAFGSNTNGNLADGTAPETIVSNSAIPIQTTASPMAEGNITHISNSFPLPPCFLSSELRDRVEHVDKMLNPNKTAKFQEDLKQYKDEIR